MEHGGVRRVELVGAEHTARAGDVQRDAAGQQGTHLIGGGLRAQHHVGADEAGRVMGLVALDIEGVLHLAGGMIRAEVQGVEVIPFGLHLGAGGDLPSHGDEQVLDVLHELGQRVTGAERATVDRQRHVDGLGLQRALLLLRLELGLLGAERAAEVGAELAHKLAGFLLLIDRQRPDGLAGLGHRRFGTGVLRFDGFELLQAGGVLNLADALGDRIGH